MNTRQVVSRHHEMDHPIWTLANTFSELKKTEAEYSTQSTTFKFNKILLLQKLSKLEIEQLRRPDLSERQLEQSIRKRGIDYAEMVRHHKVNKEFQNKVHACFEKLALETKIVNRWLSVLIFYITKTY